MTLSRITLSNFISNLPTLNFPISRPFQLPFRTTSNIRFHSWPYIFGLVLFLYMYVGKIQSKIGTLKIDMLKIGTFLKSWAHTKCVWRKTVLYNILFIKMFFCFKMAKHQPFKHRKNNNPFSTGFCLDWHFSQT